ncbi:SDR family oxidoreductase [Lichenibacterium dinghuense]|uniref:SDR family oxidoreductase n=1 Tax=Lichenibacterium dinghuense TaxID=2895977 RepID=UPI001F467A67|nr:SDR family oxidoreductase [Lichenibacterium sp. 6Y81]
MRMTGNTILITGGGSGIGRALAESFHRLGNQVIVSGRRLAALEEVTAANPGMAALELDVADPADVARFAAELVRRHPELDAVIHNAGIMKPEDATADDWGAGVAEATVATNLLGPIRLTAALLPHLRSRPRSAILTMSSGLAFVPLAATPAYSATKAAIHSWSMALRRQLKGTTTEVIEIAPPYVQTELMGAQQAADPRAMPLDAFISEVMTILTERPDAEEVIVERCRPLRFAAEEGRLATMFDTVNAMH